MCPNNPKEDRQRETQEWESEETKTNNKMTYLSTYISITLNVGGLNISLKDWQYDFKVFFIRGEWDDGQNGYRGGSGDTVFQLWNEEVTGMKGTA